MYLPLRYCAAAVVKHIPASKHVRKSHAIQIPLCKPYLDLAHHKNQDYLDREMRI